MRKLMVLLFGFCLALAAARADDQDGAKAILDKAIQAAGGEETLAKLKAVTVKGKGTPRSVTGSMTHSSQNRGTRVRRTVGD